MIFIYSKWKKFCQELNKKNIISIPACEVQSSLDKYLVLKHDVETKVSHAYKLARIEHLNGHCGSYYVQAYLLDNQKNVRLLKEMQAMGHEISYHYDVMDSNKGDIEKALVEFEGNLDKFRSNGFDIKTVCQHGNPIVERKGYNSNRDFFRDYSVNEKYQDISDIMVNFKEKKGTEYLYFSDAGRKFKLIYDPINNDIVDSSDKDKVVKNLDELTTIVCQDGRYIVSIHPHRWTNSRILYLLKSGTFKMIRVVAKLLIKVPFMKKIFSKYYYLANNI